MFGVVRHLSGDVFLGVVETKCHVVFVNVAKLVGANVVVKRSLVVVVCRRLKVEV